MWHLFPAIGVAQFLANITQEAKILQDLKTSAAPQTQNAPNAPDAIQLKFGLSDLTVDRLKRMTGPRDPISPDTYPK